MALGTKENVTQSATTAEYADCISAEGVRPPQRVFWK